MIDFLYPLLMVLHVFVCLFLILLVLFQSDKGGGLAGALGGMGSGAAFSGTSAESAITKLTRWTAIALFVVIISINILAGKKGQGGGVESELTGGTEQSQGGFDNYFSNDKASQGDIPGLEVEKAPVKEEVKTPAKEPKKTPAKEEKAK